MSAKHDVIVSFIAGKMQKNGFTIKNMEGNHTSVTITKPDLPPALSTHRPDVFGISDQAICIGEAKTPSDLKTARTRTQLLEFVKFVRSNPQHLLIIGIPQGAKKQLIDLLYSLGITVDNQIDIMEIPLQFLPLHGTEI
jgi:hypothetical protein